MFFSHPFLYVALQFGRELHCRSQILVGHYSCNVITGSVSLVTKDLEFLHESAAFWDCEFKGFNCLDVMSGLGRCSVAVSAELKAAMNRRSVDIASTLESYRPRSTMLSKPRISSGLVASGFNQPY